jgi:protein-tyrosine phosphatase
MRTNQSSPLEIAAVAAPGVSGLIGLTLCPGKKDPAGGWHRDLHIDVATIRDWGAEVVVSLIETSEFALLDVLDLPSVVEEYGLRWAHLPIADVSVPDERFETRWVAAGADLRAVVRRGGRVLVHCRGGLGRAGMIAARLLVELGTDPEGAIRAVRRVRPGAIETREQERYIRSCHPMSD